MAELDITQLISKPWQTFLKKTLLHKDTEVRFWKEPQLLGYFCQRYQDHFGSNYALSFKGAPSKCTEIIMIKKIMAMLNSSRAIAVKTYLDWVFETKVINKKVRLTSIGFFTGPSLINEFQLLQQNKNKITKTTLLPSEYQQVANTLNVPVSTYGDLAFIKLALEQDNSEARAPYRSLLSTLQTLGLETSILADLK